MLLYYMAVFWLFVLVCIAFAVIRINRKIQVGRFKNKVYVLYDASQNESSLLWLYFIHLNLEKVKEWCFGTTHTLIVGKGV